MEAAKQARELTALDFSWLARSLSADERGAVRDALRGLLHQGQRKSQGKPKVGALPTATPIVASYVRGELRGCALERGTAPAADRLAKAFASSTQSIRDDVDAEVFYPREFRWLDDIDSLEIGTEGVALVLDSAGATPRGAAPGTSCVLLMPRVARDHRVDTRGLLRLLAQKAGLESDLASELPKGARLAAWTCESVVARSTGDDVEDKSAQAASSAGSDAADYAAAWIARMFDVTGPVAFALDPRSRVLQPTGKLWHARSAITIEAVAAYCEQRGNAGELAKLLPRARRWLGRELEHALQKDRGVSDWPDDRASVAGTLALACLAGVAVQAPLRKLVVDGRWRDVEGSPVWPWHAGQIACALGRDAPDDLWAYCVASLESMPFAPYVALAAKVRGDEPAHRRAVASVAAFIRRDAPHAGGATVTAMPETALTAVAAQALAGSAEHRSEHAAALAFVRARQLLPGCIPAALDPALALGGFAGTPVDDVQRADIAGHALLALLA